MVRPQRHRPAFCHVSPSGRSRHTRVPLPEDPFLRGTSLEYLESSLPPEIRKPLWPYLEDRRPRRAAAVRPTEEALAKLIESNESMVIHLDELRRKGE